MSSGDSLELPATPQFTPVLISGAWTRPYHWQPTVAELEKRGYTPIVPELPAEDVTATFDDDGAAIYEQTRDEGLPLLYVGHSRGGEGALRVLKRLERQSELQRVLGVLMVSNAGPHGYAPKPKYSGEPPLLRYNPLFFYAVRKLDNGITDLDPEISEKLLFNDVLDDAERYAAVDALGPQRMVDEHIREVPAIPEGVPIFCVRGRDDKLHKRERLLRVTEEYYKTELIEVDGGHMLPTSQPITLANLIIQCAAEAAARRQ